MKKAVIAVLLCIAVLHCGACRKGGASSAPDVSSASASSKATSSASVSSVGAAASSAAVSSAASSKPAASVSSATASSAAASRPMVSSATASGAATSSATASSAAASSAAASSTAGSSAAASQTPVKSQYVLVSLGDSITEGYGLSDAASQRYSARLGVSLSAGGQQWTDCNYGVSGYTSADLLAQLRAGEAARLKDADKIVICIGANNILGPAVDLMKKVVTFTVDEDGTVHFQAQKRDVSAEYRVFNQQAQQGVQQLESDLPQILSYVRSVNASAQITLLTIYNPYKNSDISLNLGGLATPLSVISDTQVSALNKVIRAQAQSSGCVVADVYTAFGVSSETLVNADQPGSAYPDPHPNARGHEVIAQTVLHAAA